MKTGNGLKSKNAFKSFLNFFGSAGCFQLSKTLFYYILGVRMYKKILFTTTASPICDNAAKVAFDIAKKYQAELHILHVFGVPSHGFSTYVIDRITGNEESCGEDYIEWVKEEMKTTYSAQLETYPIATIDAIAGVPHTEILRKARKDNFDLIIMGAHTRTEDTSALRYRNIVGSTMQKVASCARMPVLIVSRPCTTCYWYFENIIFATDFSKKSHHAFQYAYDAAKKIGCKLYIFHAIDINSNEAMSQEEIENRVKKARKEAELYYIPKMNDFDNYEIEVLEGTPYVEILKYARMKNGDLIVMAHHTKKTAVEKAVLSNIVEQVVLRSSCPVATVNHSPVGV